MPSSRLLVEAIVNDKTLKTLEFPRILEQLSAFVSFGPTKELVADLTPSTDVEEVKRRLALTTEALRLLELKNNFSVGGARDIRAAIRRAELGGSLDPGDLLDIRSTLASVRMVRNLIPKLENQFPLMAEIASRLADCPRLEADIDRCIGPRGEIVDDASETLRRIRISVRAAHERLLNKLNDIIASSRYRQALQEPIITQRDGRYVVPVKADFRGQLRGVVHDQSASGATLYVEPLATVELHNRWRELQMEEQREVERILRELSVGVAAVAPELRANVAALAEIDFAIAKARLAREMRATEPAVADHATAKGGDVPMLELRSARHPLLKGTVVPIDVWIGPDFSILVITGPNTGGKTVALKTVGLLTLMAQAGLHLPVAEGSRVCVFSGVYADIGDEQSIEQNLSTFSSHMTNIVSILHHADEQSLVLLDELGAGTDPAEGSVLARAILAHLLERGVTVIATTHYSELKAFAHLTPGIQNASVEFDVRTLSPTYKLSIGLPGRSNALAIATRLGLPREIVRAAKGLMDPRKVEVEALLGRIRDERQAAREAKAAAASALEDARKLQNRLAAEWREIETERRRILQEARQTAEAELETMRARLARAMALVEAGIATREQIREAADEIRAVEREMAAAPPPPPVVETYEEEQAEEETVPGKVAVGQTVWVSSLGQEGELLSLPDAKGEVEVQMGALKMRVKATDVQPGRRSARAVRPQPTVQISPSITQREAPPVQLDLRGMRAEAALEILDKYIEDAYLSGLPFVRIVHGKGTGVLRQVVREHLGKHALVRGLQQADAKEGGEGATVAQLANS